MTDNYLFGGLIRLHILYHAAEAPVYGQGISEELASHGYEISAGTLYPMLHGMEERGYLQSHSEREGRFSRRVYVITPHGKLALEEARQKVQELFGEISASPGQ